MISHFVILLLTITNAGCVLDAPRTVKLSSKNLMTFLTWEPPTGSSSETRYQVEYKLFGHSGWIQKKECWNVSLVQCDLTYVITHVTPYLFGHVRAISYGNESDWVVAKMSIPPLNMTIDPPRFRLVPETNSMQVHIHPSFENCADVEKIEYMIHFKRRNASLSSVKKISLHTYKMEGLAPGTEYCVSVFSKIWTNHTQKPEYYKSAESETCAFTETDQRHLQLIMHLSVGLLMPLLLISVLLLLICAFKSIYRPPAQLPLNLVFTAEEQKTLRRKTYVHMEQYEDDSADRSTGNQSKAKTNLYITLPQTMPLSECPILTPSDEPLMGFSTPPPLLEGAHHVQGYAPQLSFPGAPIDESYGAVHHGTCSIDTLGFGCGDPKTGSMLVPGLAPVYINSEHPEPVHTNPEHPEPVYTNSRHTEPVYTNSEHPKSVYINSEHPKPVYTNYKCSKPVYSNFQHPKPVDTNSEPSSH